MRIYCSEDEKNRLIDILASSEICPLDSPNCDDLCVNCLSKKIEWIVPEQTGMWIEDNDRDKSSVFHCSVCGSKAYYFQPTRIKDWKKKCQYKICPNCGCDMES